MTAFQIDFSDNVATALEEIAPGTVTLRGDANKIALRDIAEGEDIIKYGVRIGRAVKPISKGSWVHLHNIHSVYDERSSHLDAVTGAPKDTRYE